jgi:hypothetical protein
VRSFAANFAYALQLNPLIAPFEQAHFTASRLLGTKSD